MNENSRIFSLSDEPFIIYYFLKRYQTFMLYQKNREILHDAYKNKGLHVANCPLHLTFTDTTVQTLKTFLTKPAQLKKKGKACEKRELCQIPYV
jgi:hypothetical protein